MLGNYFSVSKILLMSIIMNHAQLCSLDIFTPSHCPFILNIFPIFLLFVSLDYMLVIFLTLSSSLPILPLSVYNFWLNQRFFLIYYLFIIYLLFLFNRHSILFFKLACLLLIFSSASFFLMWRLLSCSVSMLVLISEVLRGLYLPFLAPAQRDSIFFLELYL